MDVSFGVNLGQLVAKKRKLKGWSQQKLTDEAGLGNRARISDLESGKVAAPNTNTITQIRSVLVISDAEMAWCHGMSEGLDLPTDLLENLAQRFGHANPDAPEAELVAFLKETAKEWQALKERLAGLEAMDGRLANLRGAAEAAIAAGDFAEADARLADAEEMQQAERTLAEVRKQAEVREARGMAALMGGDEAAAAAHFETAAGFFEPFDADEGWRRLNGLAGAIRRRGVAFGGDGLAQAIRLHELNLAHWTREAAPQDWAMTQNNLAIALRNQAARVEGAAGAALLGRAVAAYGAELEVYTREVAPQDWAATQNNLGTALCDQAGRTEGAAGAALLGRAVVAYEAALEVRTREAAPQDWAMTQNNLGNALVDQAARTEGAAGAALLGRAVAAYEAALEVNTREAAPQGWAMTQNNLAVALRDQAARVEGAAGAALLGRAVVAYEAALEVRTREAAPQHWAMTQNNLGNALCDQAARVEGAAGAALLGRAVAAYEAALEVFTPEFGPYYSGTLANLQEARAALAAREE